MIIPDARLVSKILYTVILANARTPLIKRRLCNEILDRVENDKKGRASARGLIHRDENEFYSDRRASMGESWLALRAGATPKMIPTAADTVNAKTIADKVTAAGKNC